MNNMIAGLIGLGVGVAAGAVAANAFLRAKYEERVNREMNEFRAYYQRTKNAAEEAEMAEGFTHELSQKNDAKPTETKNVVERREVRTAAVLTRDSRGRDKRTAATEEEIQAAMTAAQQYQPLEIDEKMIDVITWDQFIKEYEHYDQISIVFYSGDETLCDDNGQPIMAPVDIVGDALDKFGVGSNDPNIVYVRNHNLHTHFEIARVPGCYYGETMEEAMERFDDRTVADMIDKPDMPENETPLMDERGRPLT